MYICLFQQITSISGAQPKSSKEVYTQQMLNAFPLKDENASVILHHPVYTCLMVIDSVSCVINKADLLHVHVDEWMKGQEDITVFIYKAKRIVLSYNALVWGIARNMSVESHPLSSTLLVISKDPSA